MGLTLDDTSLFVPMFSSVCTRCAHFDDLSVFGDKKTCTAFPQRIPGEIWLGKNKHTTPYKDDHGIRFKLHPEAKNDS